MRRAIGTSDTCFLLSLALRMVSQGRNSNSNSQILRSERGRRITTVSTFYLARTFGRRKDVSLTMHVDVGKQGVHKGNSLPRGLKTPIGSNKLRGVDC